MRRFALLLLTVLASISLVAAENADCTVDSQHASGWTTAVSALLMLALGAISVASYLRTRQNSSSAINTGKSTNELETVDWKNNDVDSTAKSTDATDSLLTSSSVQDEHPTVRKLKAMLPYVVAVLSAIVCAGFAALTLESGVVWLDPTANCVVVSPAADQCALLTNVTNSGIVNGGCQLQVLNVSSCLAAREKAGLSGFWLKYSCRVNLTISGTAVQVATDGLPTYTSPYFPATDPCYNATMPQKKNPNQIAAQKISMAMPLKPNNVKATQSMGPVGVAINGVLIYNNQAAPGDDIYLEHQTFDTCMGHPTPRNNQYHFHCEAPSISYNDSNLIGVLRDGQPVYGRQCLHDIAPQLDAFGGHVATTVDSPDVPVYHYHANLQTSTTVGTKGMSQWFLTTGTYQSAPGACTGCGPA